MICIFIFGNYGDINAKGIREDSANSFEGDMVIFLFLHVGLIVFERFIHRSDTKKTKTEELKNKFGNIKTSQLLI